MIVAIESASTDPSVAVTADDGEPLAVDGWSGGPGQGREIMPRLLAAVERAGRRLGETTAVAVGIGPGSFTGLRVGMSLAKGIAFGLEVPIVGIPSLVAWLAAEPDARAALAAERLAADGSGDDLRTLEPAYLRMPRGIRELPAETVKWL